MARKKIVFVIVEGPSDDDALSLLLSRIYDKDTVHVHIMHGDITSDKDVTPTNIVTKLCDTVKDYAESSHFVSEHFQEIIHLVDTDGAYIPDVSVVEDKKAVSLIYSETEIRTANKCATEQRNKRKKANINKLCTCKNIWGISPSVTTLNNKRTTRTGGILQYPRPIRVVTLKRLNRRVRNRTHGGVRGRGYSALPTRL